MEKMDNASKSIFESYDRESNIQLEVSKDRNPGNFTRLAKFTIDEKSKIQGKMKPNLKIEENNENASPNREYFERINGNRSTKDKEMEKLRQEIEIVKRQAELDRLRYQFGCQKDEQIDERSVDSLMNMLLS